MILLKKFYSIYEQRALFKRNLKIKNNDDKFIERISLFFILLSIGFLISNYKIQSQEPIDDYN